MKRLAVIVLNYRRAALTLECIESLRSEIEGRDDRCVVLIDNGSDDDSAEQLARAVAERGWSDWVAFVASPVNGGFAAGNNLGFRTVEAEAYLLLNSDARVRPGAIGQMLSIQDANPDAGMIGPRLEDPDGTPQISCFRYRTPISEMLAAAATGPLTALFKRWVIAIGVMDAPAEPPWVSFACVLIRREVIERVGPMDEEYFMYFEDIDYARRVRRADWRVLHDPSVHVIHLRGGSSSVKKTIRERSRVPRYYYESRSRYFAKFYGGVLGLWMTNALWMFGRCVSLMRELVRNKEPHTCQADWIDNWTNWLHPMRSPELPKGGEL